MIKPLFQRILVAYNGSKSSLHAFMYAVMMAKSFKCKVKAVYVVDTETIRKLTLTKFLMKEEGSVFKDDLKRDGDRGLDYIARLAKAKGIKIETEMRHGAVWSEIVKAADEYKADLLLIGGGDENTSSMMVSHGLAGMQDSEIIGSSHCSVMVVKHPYIEQLFKIL